MRLSSRFPRIMQRRRRVVTRILNSAQRMERMIGDFLDLSRARFGGTMPITRRGPTSSSCAMRSILESRTAHPEAALRFNASGDLVGTLGR